MEKLNALPGPRYIGQGKGSGEYFRNEFLLPAFEEAQEKSETLIIDMDGAKYGYPTSFLEEAFGGLARIKGINAVRETIKVVCSDEPLLIDEIEHYITNSDSYKVPPFEASAMHY